MNAEALAEVIQELDYALEKLNEYQSIGLWSQSDDSSDNRNKRQALRDADWRVAGAQRAAAGEPALAPLAADLIVLLKEVEPLADGVTDWMGTNSSLDSDVYRAERLVKELRDRVAQLLKA